MSNIPKMGHLPTPVSGDPPEDIRGLGKFDHDLTAIEPWESWLGFGKSSPFMAELFRLVKYYNLPRWGVPSGYD